MEDGEQMNNPSGSFVIWSDCLSFSIIHNSHIALQPPVVSLMGRCDAEKQSGQGKYVHQNMQNDKLNVNKVNVHQFQLLSCKYELAFVVSEWNWLDIQ